jgi:hypothetical protein
MAADISYSILEHKPLIILATLFSFNGLLQFRVSIGADGTLCGVSIFSIVKYPRLTRLIRHSSPYEKTNNR